MILKGSYSVEGDVWSNRILKVMTGSKGTFQDQIEIWYKRNSQKSIRIIPAKGGTEIVGLGS